VIPRDAPRAVPLVVLLHGLGETSDERLGSRAWVDRYGLVTSAARLAQAPLARVSSRDDWSDAGLAEANDALAARPYRGLAFACPYVPRLRDAQLGAYARWLADAVVPRARHEAGGRVDASPARIAGCSYGAWVALEALLRAPEGFGAFAGVQTAISRASAASYAERLARLATSAGNLAHPLFLETSTRDPFHDPTLALAEALRARNLPRELVVLPGPHDQPWLRESGTPRMLVWLDRT
jgi:predicted esterase